MWFGEVTNIGRIDMAGTVTHFPADPGPQGAWIRVGPDGALWYTEWPNHVGRTDMSGTHTTRYGIDLDGYVHSLAFDQAGAMWVTVSGSPPDFTNLRRVPVTGGSFAEFTVTGEDPQAITLGPDGAMWFVTQGGRIGRIGANGAITLFPIPTSNSQPVDIISGPDGAIWFTEGFANKIGRITTDGVITEYALPPPPPGSSCTSNVGPLRIAVGPDGAFWFTQPCLNRIGRFSLTAPAKPPSTGGVSPPQGSGTSQDFIFHFSSAAGWQNLDVVNILINTALDGRRACYLAYAVSSTTLFLVNDAGDAGGPYAGSVTPQNAGTLISNSQCSVSLNSAVGSGPDLMLDLTVRFQPGFGGNLVQYLAARDTAQNNSGWQASGVWNSISETPPGPILVGSIAPGRMLDPAGVTQTVTFTIADANGASGIGIVNLLVNNFIDGREACYLAYVSAANSLFLVDDAGDAGGPFAGSIQLNGSGSIRNSQCSVSGQGSSAVASGNQLTLTLAITFLSPLTGNRIMWVAGRDAAGSNNTGWQAIGTALIQ